MDRPDGSVAKKRSPQKRVVTERRRLQNKHAQNTYRQRQRKHLRFLEDLAVTKGFGESKDVCPQARTESLSASISKRSKRKPVRESFEGPAEGMISAFGGSEEMSPEFNAAPSKLPSQNARGFHLHQVRISEISKHANPYLQTTNQTDWCNEAERLPLLHASNDWESTVPATSLMESNALPCLSPSKAHSTFPYVAFRPINGLSFGSLRQHTLTMEKALVNQSTQQADCQPSRPPGQFRHPAPQISPQSDQQCNAVENLMGSDVLTQGVLEQESESTEASHLGIRPQSSSNYRASPSLSQQQIMYNLPDVHTNNLRVLRIDTACAYIMNANILGILDYNDLFSPLCPSPFHLPAPQPSDVASSDSSFFHSTLPPNLLPTPPQQFHNHHTWIDLLPFPSFRAWAISSATAIPRLYDPHELKYDAVYRGGLICWRGAGASGTGQPWDRRSWEAALWFVRKWWMLTGGDDGEIGEQSRWWRGLRGEDDLEMV